ncbi:hypothetical protein CBR_g31937 [Chara braunii]|uniref:Endonuclease/exonuclease/phosphatase domain-containing protein n=1 Tax=Chara braunii TaxID=69332 RepID=A0A388LG22_CHABU|nr:hypothetical protein CBR_g31937 [Chara braunii]|eukprot:GBG81265.1 hypothetical protein CBR_g31937 [Chara braunii]
MLVSKTKPCTSKCEHFALRGVTNSGGVGVPTRPPQRSAATDVQQGGEVPNEDVPAEGLGILPSAHEDRERPSNGETAVLQPVEGEGQRLGASGQQRVVVAGQRPSMNRQGENAFEDVVMQDAPQAPVVEIISEGQQRDPHPLQGILEQRQGVEVDRSLGVRRDDGNAPDGQSSLLVRQEGHEQQTGVVQEDILPGQRPVPRRLERVIEVSDEEGSNVIPPRSASCQEIRAPLRILTGEPSPTPDLPHGRVRLSSPDPQQHAQDEGQEEEPDPRTAGRNVDPREGKFSSERLHMKLLDGVLEEMLSKERLYLVPLVFMEEASVLQILTVSTSAGVHNARFPMIALTNMPTQQRALLAAQEWLAVAAEVAMVPGISAIRLLVPTSHGFSVGLYCFFIRAKYERLQGSALHAPSFGWRNLSLVLDFAEAEEHAVVIAMTAPLRILKDLDRHMPVAKLGMRGGGAIIFTRFFTRKIMDFFWDTMGRWAWVFIEEGGKKLLVVNVYAPVDVTERKWFWRNFTACLPETDAMLLIGDFNTVICPGRDSVVQGDPKPDAEALCALMEDMAMVDAFRRISPDDRCFTWFGTSPLLRSRLDMAWISSDLLPNLQSFDQHLVPISDHKFICVSLALHPRVLKRPPPPMSVPTWLLSDALNRELVQQHWECWLRSRPQHMPLLEHLQNGVRTLAVNMKKRAKISRQAHDQTGQYLRRMEALGEIPPAGSEDDWWAEWVLLYSEWAGWQARDAELWGLSSKTKWVGDAERMPKAFFAQMKNMSGSPLIVEMGHPFEPLKVRADNTPDILKYVELFYKDLYQEDERWSKEDMAVVPAKDVWDKCVTQVSPEERAILDAPITQEEVARAMTGMHKGEILGFMDDELLRKHLPRTFSLIKNESWGIEDDQIPS